MVGRVSQSHLFDLLWSFARRRQCYIGHWRSFRVAKVAADLCLDGHLRHPVPVCQSIVATDILDASNPVWADINRFLVAQECYERWIQLCNGLRYSSGSCSPARGGPVLEHKAKVATVRQDEEERAARKATCWAARRRARLCPNLHKRHELDIEKVAESLRQLQNEQFLRTGHHQLSEEA